MGFFNLFKSTPGAAKSENQPPQSNSKIHKHKIAGVAHYESNLLKLAFKNPAYSFTKKEIIAKRLYCKNLYEYSFAPKKTELLPNPTNPQDPNAIKVIIDGQHVGFIKSGSCGQILKLIKEERIARIESNVSGGRFQNLWSDGKEIQQHEKGCKKYEIEISIFEK